MSKFHYFNFVFVAALALTGCLKQTINGNGVGLPQEQQEAGKSDQDGAEKKTVNPALTDPKLASKQAPDTYRVRVETTKGDFIIEVTREWAPNGADRFYNLVDIGFFEDIAIFRAIKGFMFQFGIHGNPAISEHWREANIPDDKRQRDVSNKPGTISFANSGPDTRSTQLFVNLGNNANLDGMGFTPFGKVVEGMEIVSQINTEYGENSREVQPRFQSQGNVFIKKRYPKIDYIKSIKLIEN